MAEIEMTLAAASTAVSGEIALVAEDVDAAHRIAVDAGCEPLAAPS